MEEHVKLGDHVRDPITGFEGTITTRTDYLYGCVRVGVTAHELDKDGKEKYLAFDLAGLELVEAGKHAPKVRNVARPPGGPERIENRMPVVPTRTNR